MSDTPRMDSAFNQPTSTTPRMNWQLDQCYKEGCKLERELATVAEQRDEARAVLVYEQGGIHATAGGWAAKYAEAIEQRDRLAEVAQAVWDRWETPLWKDHPPTALVMNKLRDALEAVKGGSHE